MFLAGNSCGCVRASTFYRVRRSTFYSVADRAHSIVSQTEHVSHLCQTEQVSRPSPAYLPWHFLGRSESLCLRARRRLLAWLAPTAIPLCVCVFRV